MTIPTTPRTVKRKWEKVEKAPAQQHLHAAVEEEEEEEEEEKDGSDGGQDTFDKDTGQRARKTCGMESSKMFFHFSHTDASMDRSCALYVKASFQNQSQHCTLYEDMNKNI